MRAPSVAAVKGWGALAVALLLAYLAWKVWGLLSAGAAKVAEAAKVAAADVASAATPDLSLSGGPGVVYADPARLAELTASWEGVKADAVVDLASGFTPRLSNAGGPGAAVASATADPNAPGAGILAWWRRVTS